MKKADSAKIIQVSTDALLVPDLNGRSQVDTRVVIGDIGFEFRAFFNQKNVRIEDMLIFGVSGHGGVGNNLVTFCLSANISFRIRDIFAFTDQLPIHCTVEIFLDVCHAAKAAEQHGLYKIWPSDELLSGLNLRDGIVRARMGPKMILWTAAGSAGQGLAYFRRNKNSYMLTAMCKVLKAHGPNLTRREWHRRIMKRLEPLNEKLQRKNKAPQIPVIFSSVADRDLILNGYALQPLLLSGEQGTT
ncbi:hypothetical protein FRC11_009931 [Ceratobasidium sp. 423]|nr:hypothetical protein FRC11_009931 [Ceratobasidium sp. 423]